MSNIKSSKCLGTTIVCTNLVYTSGFHLTMSNIALTSYEILDMPNQASHLTFMVVCLEQPDLWSGHVIFAAASMTGQTDKEMVIIK